MMKRTTIMAHMEGHRQRLNEGLIFWKATNDIERAGSEYTTTEYTEESREFYDSGELPFNIEAGAIVRPLLSYHKGMEVVIGFTVKSSVKVFVEEITEYDVQRIVRDLIAAEISKEVGYGIGGFSVDCKLTKLYMEEKLTWDEYVAMITESC